MRNLKRALSLTLASVMLLGMMVVGSSAAAGYDDVKETDNVEAIEVLQTVGVMVGDERGFGPDRPVNRAEMAVVMGLLLNLDYNYYSATCPFNDVYDWARGWVGACAANGIVSGRGDGVYDPGATVTAVEGASMLMRALGYFKYASDYADGFEVSTVRQGTTIGIFDGVGSSATEPMTRNQVAQMVLNTLKSGMVQPDGNTLNYFDTNGNVIATGGKINYVYVTSDKTFARAISSTNATSMGSTNNSPIVELGEQLYNGELKLYDKREDAFGRPARIWEYKGEEIGTYVKKELLKKEYTAKVTGEELYNLLSRNTVEDYRFRIYVDGVETTVDDPSKAILESAWFDKTDLYRTNKDGVGETGKGVLTQVFVDTDYLEAKDYTVYINVINTYLAIANEDYDAKDDDVRLDVYDLRKYGTAAIYAKCVDDDNDPYYTTMTVEGDEFDIKDVKEDDMFLVNVAQGRIQTMVAPEVMSNTTINAFSKKDWINLDGTQYDYASTARYDAEVLYKYDNPNLKDVTYNVILDKYGYAIGLEMNEDPDQYVFLTGIEDSYSNLTTKTADANIIHLDGTMKTVKVDMKESKLSTFAEPSQANTWCIYRVDSNDVYTLTEVPKTILKPDGTTYDAAQWPTNVLATDDTVDIDSKHISLPTSNTPGSSNDVRFRANSVAYGDDETVYLNVELDEILDKGTNPRRVIDDVNAVVTGHKNVKISVKDVKNADSDGKTYAGTGTEYVAPKEEIYTLYDNKNYAIAVVTIGEDEGISSNWVWVTSTDVESEAYNGNTTKAANDGKWTWTRKVVSLETGEEMELKYVGDHLNQIGPDADNGNMLLDRCYEVKYDADGNVRRTEDLFTKLTDGDDTDGYVNDIKDVREAVTKKDNVLLADTALPSEIKFDDNGTLYIEYSDSTGKSTQGFRVSPEVKVVLALANKKGDPIKTVDDGKVYSGYSGLKNAIKDMNYWYTGTPGVDMEKVELIAALDSNAAKVIVIRDNNPAPENKPTGGGETGVTTGKLTITNVKNAEYISVPANDTSIKVGDTITVTVASGYQVDVVKGALAASKVGNVYTFTATSNTVEIAIVPTGGLVTNPKTLTLKGTLAASGTEVWNAAGDKKYEATPVTGIDGTVYTYTIPGDTVVKVKNASVLTTNSGFLVKADGTNEETLTVKGGVVEVTMNTDKTLSGDDFAATSQVYTINVEDGITITKFLDNTGADVTKKVDAPKSGVYTIKNNLNVTYINVKTTATEYAYITENEGQASMPVKGSADIFITNDGSGNIDKANTDAAELNVSNGVDQWIYGATKVTFTDVDPGCFGYTGNTHVVHPGSKLKVSIDLTEDGVSAAIVQEGATAVNVANDRVHNGYEIGNKEVTLKGAFKVTLNGVKAKVGSVDIADGLYYVAKGQNITNIAAVTDKGTSVLKDGKISNATSENRDINALADEVTLDAAVKVTTSGTWTGVNAVNSHGDKSPLAVTSNAVVVKTGTDIAAQADNSVYDITVGKDSVNDFAKDGNWLYFTLGVEDITLKQGT